MVPAGASIYGRAPRSDPRGSLGVNPRSPFLSGGHWCPSAASRGTPIALKARVHRVALLLLAAAGSAAADPVVDPCGCRQEPPDVAMAGAAVVFVGKVEAI